MPSAARSRKAQPAAAPGHPRDEADALFAAGNAHLRRGDRDAAIAAFDGALRLRPAFPEALRAGGAILRDCGATEGALRFFAEALRLRPDDADAALDHGNLLLAVGRPEAALASYDAILAARPGHAGLLCNRGVVLHRLGRLDEAAAAFERAVAADPALAPAYLNHAGVLMRQFRHAAALPLLDRALALQPDYAAAHTNRGLTLKMLGRFEEAATALERALLLDPGSADALTNRGELRLLLGDYEGGLRDYQARLATEWRERPLLPRPVPLWSGQPLSGLKVVAVADAGNGDILHFARYLPMFAAAGATVTVVCRPRLHRVLRPVTAGLHVVEGVTADEPFDRLVPFSNLPFVFGTTLATIPAPVPYLRAEPDRVAAWRERLRSRLGSEPRSPGRTFTIGLCWRGSQDWRADPTRSIPLDAFSGLATLPGVRLVALNIDPDGTAGFPLERFADLDSGPDSFIDTAALMASLDLVVTIDTSLAHLAGALGRLTFLLLRRVPEWRWLTEREDTPWYPTMRLFRQDRASDWEAPLARVVAAVASLIADRAQAGGRPPRAPGPAAMGRADAASAVAGLSSGCRGPAAGSSSWPGSALP